MIKTQNLTPQIYYERSRDFQLLGRLYDIIFNYMRTVSAKVSDSVLNKYTSDELIDLICYTLGFKYNPNYNIAQLRAISSVFMLALKNKGNVLAIELAVYAILHSANISSSASVSYDKENHQVIIRVPNELTSITLLQNVLDYILPAGVGVVIYRRSEIDAGKIVDTYSNISTDTIKAKSIATGRGVSLISDMNLDDPYIKNITQADLGPYRNDSMVVPTEAPGEYKQYPEEEENNE